MRDVPVIYLSTAFAGAVLRTMPLGYRRIVTHLHDLDRESVDHLPDGLKQRLSQETELWLASSAELVGWASEFFSLDAARIRVVAPVVEVVEGGAAPTDARTRLGIRPDAEVVGLAGAQPGPVGPSDARFLLEEVRRQRPAAELHLLWLDQVSDERAMRTLAQELRELSGVTLHWVNLPDSPLQYTDAVDVVAVTSADGSDFSIWQASARAKPVACYETHRFALAPPAEGLVPVPASDMGGLAARVAHLLSRPEERACAGERARRRAQACRGTARLGPLWLEELSRLS